MDIIEIEAGLAERCAAARALELPIYSAEWWKAFDDAYTWAGHQYRAEKESRKPVVVDAETGAVVERAANECVDCGNIIPPTGKRGRPAKRCGKCRGIDEGE